MSEEELGSYFCLVTWLDGLTARKLAFSPRKMKFLGEKAIKKLEAWRSSGYDLHGKSVAQQSDMQRSAQFT